MMVLYLIFFDKTIGFLYKRRWKKQIILFTKRNLILHSNSAFIKLNFKVCASVSAFDTGTCIGSAE